MRNVIVISDLHCGCRLGLCPNHEIPLDGNGTYAPSPLQVKVWDWYQEFWNTWVPTMTRGEKFAVVVNGDLVEGVHHHATTQISQNMSDQYRIAEELLRDVRERCDGKLYIVRGTPAHSGESGCHEENIARAVGAVPDQSGNYSRFDLWIRMQGKRMHFAHHIATADSMAYEITALTSEYWAMCSEAARWNQPYPSFVIRSHRHISSEIRVPTADGDGICTVTPSWQLKTPFSWKTKGARTRLPQIGGILCRVGDEELFTRHFVKNIERTAEVVLDDEDERGAECRTEEVEV